MTECQTREVVVPMHRGGCGGWLQFLIVAALIGLGQSWSPNQKREASALLRSSLGSSSSSGIRKEPSGPARHMSLFAVNGATASGSTIPRDDNDKATKKRYRHTLAILDMPITSTDRIANEAILNHAVTHTDKLSVVLRANGRNPSLARLRQYVGEVYSTLWDVAMSATGDDEDGSSHSDFCDVVVYPQNLPNAPPEQWLHHATDLDSVCSHDSICGWVSESALGRGLTYQSKLGQGMGGLDAHVRALNADRKQRNLKPVEALHVDPWPIGASAEKQAENLVTFLDDDLEELGQEDIEVEINEGSVGGGADDACELIGGARVPSGCLFDQIAVGGTFDGMHYGHRKLLTLAVSSVNPVSGKLVVGVTVDEMLKRKSYAEQIPNLKERMDGARDFIYRLAPGIKNRVKLLPISDEYGPPGTAEYGKDFDALVLSHETLENGCMLNQHRADKLGLPPLSLLCTRRTEPHGMSSTALRRRKWEQQQRREQQQRKSEVAN